MELIYNNTTAVKVPSDIMHPTSRTLFRFWEGARGELPAAKKQQLNLKKVSKILPSLCIVERHPLKQTYTWRLAGTAIGKLWGHEVTGQDLFTNWADFERQTVATGFDMVIATMQPCVVRFKATNNHGNEIGVEFLAVPIQDEKSGAIQILGTVVPFRSPDWLGTTELVSFEISTIRKIWTDSLPSQRVHSTPADYKRSQNGTMPFLKLIKGGLN